ncbi:MAG: M56 family metallopeptidase [Sedimentisphaerales bacterium]
MDTIVGVLNKAGAILSQHGLTMLLQFGLLTSLLFLADMAIRWRVKASLRYCLWCLLLVKLVLPATFASPTGIGHLLGVNFSVKLPQIEQPVTQIHTALALAQTDRDFARPASGLHTSQVVADSYVFKTQNSPVFAAGQYRHIPLNWHGCVFVAWFLGVLVFSAVFIRRLASVRAMVTQSKSAPARLVDILRICRGKVGVRGNVELRLSNRMVSPAVCGLLRPVIVIPTDLLEKTNRSKLAVIFIHELSHVKRADMWVNLFQTILQIFYFYNPFLWLANACVRRVREQAVDEMVLTRLNGAVASYSSTLIDVAEMAFLRPHFSLATAGIIESKNKLEERIKIMLNKPIPKDTKIGFAGFLLLIVTAAVSLPMAKGTDKKTEPEFVIKGSVTNAATGKPIAGAKVGDAERYAGGKYGTVTDSNGNYSYKTWYEEHDVKCEVSGYKTETKVLLTKILGSEPEKVLDFALRSEKSGGDALKAALSNSCKSNFERTEDMSAPFAEGSLLVAEIADGTITVTGGSGTECKVTAKIKTGASTAGEAEELAKQVKVYLKQETGKLTVVTEEPNDNKNRCISIDLAVTVPRKASLQCRLADGQLTCSNLEGNLTAELADGNADITKLAGDLSIKIADGKIRCADSKGSLDLQVSNGKIQIENMEFTAKCNITLSDGEMILENIRGKAHYEMEISDGKAKVAYAGDADGVGHVEIAVADGSIEFIGPANMNAKIEAEVRDGDIKTGLALPVKRELGGASVDGTLGTGEGHIELEVSNGTIELR